MESDRTDSAHPFAEKINWYAVCTDERKGVVIEASAFRCSPPQATQTLPHLSLCLHACAETVSASGDFPLPLISLSSPGTSTRSAASGSEAAATVAAATTAAAECAGRGGGVAHACARPTAAATGGGGVDVATRRRRRRRQWSVVSGVFACVRDARVMRE